MYRLGMPLLLWEDIILPFMGLDVLVSPLTMHLLSALNQLRTVMVCNHSWSILLDLIRCLQGLSRKPFLCQSQLYYSVKFMFELNGYVCSRLLL